jgi:uncharacterized membrane protein YfcA
LGVLMVAVHALVNGDPITDFTAYRLYHVATGLIALLVLAVTVVAVWQARRSRVFWSYLIMAAAHALVFMFVCGAIIIEIREDAIPLNTNWPFP